MMPVAVTSPVTFMVPEVIVPLTVRAPVDAAPVDAEANPGPTAGRTELVLYGAVAGATLYAFSFESRSPATFARDLEVFERLVASFARLEPAQGTP